MYAVINMHTQFTYSGIIKLMLVVCLRYFIRFWNKKNPRIRTYRFKIIVGQNDFKYWEIYMILNKNSLKKTFCILDNNNKK